MGKRAGEKTCAKFCYNFPFPETNMPRKVFCIADPFSDSAVHDMISIRNTFPHIFVSGTACTQKQS